jgi:energy-coupling factor transporter ATP-binding protein EcfA2
MPKIIALTGAKGCGKDTTARILHEAYHESGKRRVRPIAFADPIKHEVMRIFGLPLIADYDAFKRSTLNYNGGTIQGRQVVREIGMMMRRYDVNQFVEYVDDKIQQDPDAIWVLTDLRFDNELIHLQNLGAKIVKIDRPIGNMIDTHITERGFDNSICDIIIENKATLEEYNTQVLHVFDKKLIEWNWL